jgi:3-(3-hydroxy-phenyl)propionate hydroxylase
VLMSRRRHVANGTIFPQAWLKTGSAAAQRMDDYWGYGWRLILLTKLLDVEVPNTMTAHCLDSEALREEHGLMAAWLNKHGAIAALIRPDHYVFGLASDPAQCRELVQEFNQLWRAI